MKQPLDQYLQDDHAHFFVHRREKSVTARQSREGLLACETGHANMERMEEAVADSQSRSYQQVVSHSPWEQGAVIGQVAQTAARLFLMQPAQEDLPTGRLLDESAP